MASASAATLDTMITFKVLMDGTTRRFKLPLRDLGASTLENKLRYFLAIDADTKCVFERYSDSAGAYVVLDSANVSVYKQLYRAAKAKQKLKLRVTREQAIEAKTLPKPASVEDEEEVPKTPVAPVAPAPVATVAPAAEDVPVVSPSSSTVPGSARGKVGEAAFRMSLAKMELEQKLMQRNLDAISASVGIMRLNAPGRSSCNVARPRSAGLGATVSAATCPRFNSFAVLCNSCDKTIPDAHYHCSTCDDGDFDLCQDCVDQGITCYGSDHWLIKRLFQNGVVVNSTTETIAPKPRVTHVRDEAPLPAVETPVPVVTQAPQVMRTCNSCIEDLYQHECVQCKVCDDFDLCNSCFAKNKHGHNPAHAFAAAAEGSVLDPRVSRYLAAGRNHVHNATCDGCDKTICGVRHKCLDCPDWDYCSACVANAAFVHANHRFVPVYDHLESPEVLRARFWGRPTHVGICCDGPLCNTGRGPASYIVGDRYKCAVCNDTDFCAKCEASPSNVHNKTHPLIKFKTPVRHVSVTTTGEHESGQRMRTMGDHVLAHRVSTSSRATETTAVVAVAAPQDIVKTDVLTVADVRPVEPAAAPVKAEAKPEPEMREIKHEEPEPVAPKLTADDLVAIYKRDTIADGTVFEPSKTFEQTWILRNEGEVAWPAGCSVKYVGGDYMGHVDHDHPAGVQELASASESTVCPAAVAPGQEFAFSVLLRTPAREGKAISYWRLTTPDGIKFGHRLWCDVNVRLPKLEAPPQPHESQMIFPKLDKESPVSSIHQAAVEPVATVATRDDDYEDCVEDEAWAEDDSDSGFLTDEEYDILDASDEEYLEEQQKKVLKK